MKRRVSIDLTGQRFERLIVLKKLGTKNNNIQWLCQCDCGKQKEIAGTHLRSGMTRSCGCLLSETSAMKTRTHGKTGTKVYTAWKNMRRRCLSQSGKDWKDYGGRGIQICERWNSFENFYADMGDPTDGTSLDRIDFDGNYEPSNCRWATLVTQARNKRSNLLITYKGDTKALRDWSNQLGIHYGTLVTRMTSRKWSVEKAFETPIRITKRTKVA